MVNTHSGRVGNLPCKLWVLHVGVVNTHSGRVGNLPCKLWVLHVGVVNTHSGRVGNLPCKTVGTTCRCGEHSQWPCRESTL